jgi:hypothetical protein
VTRLTNLAVALHSGDPAFNDLPRYITDVLEPAVDQLLEAATTSGAIHAEITARHLLLTVALMCQPVPGRGPAVQRPDDPHLHRGTPPRAAERS